MNKLLANDYIGVTKSYLRNYNLYTEYLNNARHTLADIDKQLASESIKTSRYGNEPSGGYSELNGIEMSATRRMELEQEREDLCKEMYSVERVISCINRSIPKLTEDKQKLIRGFYFAKKSYIELTMDYHVSKEWCRNLLRQAESELAIMVFGMKAKPAINILYNAE